MQNMTPQIATVGWNLAPRHTLWPLWVTVVACKHTYGIFAAEHESNLTTGVSRDGAVGVLHHGE